MVFWNFTVGLKSSVNISSFFFLVFLDFRKLRKVMSCIGLLLKNWFIHFIE